MSSDFRYGRPVAESSAEPYFPRAESAEPEAVSQEPFQFGISHLLIAVTVAAVMLALFRALGIFGALASFLAAITFTVVVAPRLYSEKPALQWSLFDVVWGIVMPLVCLTFDPFLFKEDDALLNGPAVMWEQGYSPQQIFALPQVHSPSFLIYPIILAQILALSVSLVMRRMPASVAAAWSGCLILGTLLSLAIGILMFPMTVLGTLIFGVGLMGLTPLLTAYAYWRRTRLLAAQARLGTAGWALRFWLLAAVGAVVAALLPAVLGLLLLLAVRGPAGVDF